MKRTATAQCTGDLKNGNGTITSQSTVLHNTPYSFKTRFEDGIGTNPEELIAAAHAGCFTMAICAQLTQKGFEAQMLETQIIVDVDMAALKINGVHLDLKAKVEKFSDADLQTIASDAKTNCIISKILNVPITLNAVLEK
ncbi:MAG: OsmC family peroxiredoxin [Sphingobacteriales bacterium]|nr:MAG: OsmC family peroxiredoxin [Sphingobacteriales bacterium]